MRAEMCTVLNKVYQSRISKEWAGRPDERASGGRYRVQRSSLDLGVEFLELEMEVKIWNLVYLW
jgi:hypothetical protein